MRLTCANSRGAIRTSCSSNCSTTDSDIAAVSIVASTYSRTRLDASGINYTALDNDISTVMIVCTTNTWSVSSGTGVERAGALDGQGAVGGSIVVAGCKWDDSGDAKTTFFTIMPAVKYKWAVQKYVSWYSKAAIGIMFTSDSGMSRDNRKDDKSSASFNFQVSFVGLEFGSAFRGFVELGVGEQGIILGGVRYKF